MMPSREQKKGKEGETLQISLAASSAAVFWSRIG